MNDEQILQLINLLPRNSYLTSGYLADLLEVSSRTVRKRIKDLGEILKKKGCEIEAKTGSGFRLVIKDEKAFLQFLENCESRKSLFPTSKSERIQYILDYLLLSENEFVKIDDLSRQLFISRTIISEDLKIVKEKISKYNIKIVNTPKYGLKLIGSEFNMRLCIANNVTSDLIGNDDSKDVAQGELQKISEILINLLEENKYHLSGMAYQNLVTHIYLMLKRSNFIKDNSLLSPRKTDEVKELYKREISISKELISQLQVEFKCYIDSNEIYYLAIHLAGKRVIDGEKTTDDNIVIPDEISEIVKEMLDTVNDYFRIDFRNDLELRMSLCLHLIPLKTRIKYALNTKNPLLKEIKTRFTLAYTIAVQACTVFESKFSMSIDETEIGFFALHFNLALERKKLNPELKNVLIVCSSGKGTSQLLAYRCRSEFGNYVNKVEACNLYQLEQIDFRNFDYIFTTVPINYPVPIPILEIKYFLEGEDLKDAKKLFLQDEMDSVFKYFNENLFLTNLEFDTKEQVLQYMVNKISEVKEIPDNFLDAVIKREEQAVTEFGNLVALPHPNIPLTDETFVTIAVLDKPILWEKQKVQFICLMSIEKNVEKDLQLFYKVISRFLISNKDIQGVLAKKNYFHFLSTLKKVEGNLAEI